MISSIVDSFLNLDEDNKTKVIKIISKIINPIKLYLIFIIFLLLIICVSNYYICKKFISLNIPIND